MAKVKKRSFPVKLKPCLKGGVPPPSWLVCFIARPSRKKAKRHVAEYHTISGSTLGFLGPKCAGTHKRKEAISFPSKKAAEYAVQSCQLYINNPGKHDLKKIYAKAQKMDRES